MRVEGVLRVEGNKRGKWDNCSSIINKTYFKKRNRKLWESVKLSGKVGMSSGS